MKWRLRQRPSVGFVFLVSSHLLLISMLAWGYTKPELDKVWLITQRMQRDSFNGLSALDMQTIRTALLHYPDLPRAFIGRAPFGFVEPTDDGWVKLSHPHLITDGTMRGTVPMTVECRAPQSAFPLVVSFDYEGRHQSLRFLENGQQSLELQSDSQPRSVWVQVSVEPAQTADPQRPTPEIRIKAPTVPGQTAAP